VAIDNAIRSMLRLNGGKIGSVFSGTHLDASVSRELARLRQLGYDISEVVEPALAIAVALHRTLEKSDRRLGRTAKENDVCNRLMTVPGVGPICAISFYTAVENPHRFEKNDDIGPYFGLVPKVSQSGLTIRRGRISKMGNTMTRTHLVSAAKSLMQQPARDCDLREWAIALAKRSGLPKARVALARKLAIAMLAIWKSGETFVPHHKSSSRT
jgi:transposase